MGLLDRIKNAGSVLFGSSFEGANNSQRRGRVPGASPTDFKHEFEGGTRLEIVKRSRYLMKNSGLPREHRDLNVLYSVGDGLSPQAHTESREWNREAEAYFAEWSRRADVTERFSFSDIQKLASKSIDTDGELFVVKTRNNRTKEPRLQLIETHRVGNFMERDENNWVDGIRLDVAGRPTAIRVLRDTGNTRSIPYSAVMHLFEAESPSAYRHPPMFAHSVNHMLDETELIALEKHAVKDNSDISRVLKTDKGRLDNSGDFSATGGTDTETTDPRALQKILGGKLVAVQPHESIESYNSNRPSPTFTGFLEHLRRDSSLGSLPYEFVVDPSGATGPAVRMVVAKAQRRFKARTDLIANKLVKPTWFYVVGAAIDNGILPSIKSWSNISVGGLRDITVDAGRDSESNRRDVQMGLKLPSTSYAEQGDDFIDAMEAKAHLIQSVRDIAKAHDIDPELLFNFSTEKNNSGSATTPPSAK